VIWRVRPCGLGRGARPHGAFHSFSKLSRRAGYSKLPHTCRTPLTRHCAAKRTAPCSRCCTPSVCGLGKFPGWQRRGPQQAVAGDSRLLNDFMDIDHPTEPGMPRIKTCRASVTWVCGARLYNHERLHQALGYRAPRQVFKEARLFTKLRRGRKTAGANRELATQ
jgi:hypothetical protein